MILIADSGSTKPTGASFSTAPQSKRMGTKELIPSSNQKKKFNKS